VKLEYRCDFKVIGLFEAVLLPELFFENVATPHWILFLMLDFRAGISIVLVYGFVLLKSILAGVLG